jgi:hypothetical protein
LLYNDGQGSSSTADLLKEGVHLVERQLLLFILHEKMLSRYPYTCSSVNSMIASAAR